MNINIGQQPPPHLEEKVFQPDEGKLIQAGNVLNEIRATLKDLPHYNIVEYDSMTSNLLCVCFLICDVRLGNYHIRYYFKNNVYSICESYNKTRLIMKNLSIEGVKQFLIDKINKQNLKD